MSSRRLGGVRVTLLQAMWGLAVNRAWRRWFDSAAREE